ncbi:acyl-CoA synthetase [Comamonas serinivorans]|uniref:Acyl-CoA synthetase n=1 Tax=Comamonas serinivorans TaxID=1082851 RepID=A0A1Y0ENT0_9BURK|nr:acyl-CoA synthetase [Comamonas serinivorans]ARU05294.1 acyl-CoA synthetase [Comamonas serinivorans]
MSTPHNRQTLGDLLRRSAKRMPDKLAVRCGQTDWTFAEFDRVSDRLAAGLAGLNVQLGDRVAVLARNSHAFVALRFALARLGAVIVPINYMLNASEVRYILDHAGATVLCVDTEMAAVGREASQGTAVREWVWLPSEGPSAPVADARRFEDLLLEAAPPARELDGRQVAQIIYTSGTESAPKGALLTHEAVIAEYVTCLVDAEIHERDTLLHALPLYHCAQLDAFFGPAVYVGATSVITAKPTPDNLLALITANGINSFFAPPTVWISLLRSPLFDQTDLSRLAKGYYGASIMPVEVLKELQRRAPQLRLWNLYGQTEIAPVATVLRPEDQMRKAGSAGKPGLNIETRLVDDDMNDVPQGEVGEIVHRSPQLLTGYYNAPEQTAKAFAGGWFHSGDLGVMDAEGYLTVVDRKKDMIKTGGENVSSREVEEAIYTIPGVSEVAVIGLPHERWIEMVTAVIVAKEGAVLSEDGLLAACRERLATYKVPKRIILTDALPKNPSGKLLKRELRKQWA